MSECVKCKSTDKPLIKKIAYYVYSEPIHYYVCHDCEKQLWEDVMDNLRGMG